MDSRGQLLPREADCQSPIWAIAPSPLLLDEPGIAASRQLTASRTAKANFVPGPTLIS